MVLEHKRLDLTTPERVDDFLVRQNGVCGQRVGDKKKDDRRRTGQADANAGSRCSEATEEQKHDDHQQSRPDSSSRVVGPLSMAPLRQQRKECQNQDDSQCDSEHLQLLFRTVLPTIQWSPADDPGNADTGPAAFSSLSNNAH